MWPKNASKDVQSFISRVSRTGGHLCCRMSCVAVPCSDCNTEPPSPTPVPSDHMVLRSLETFSIISTNLPAKLG